MSRNKYSKEIKIEMPDAVKEIIGVLSDAGYEAYAVGGCVRDSVLGRVPKDWDITTIAKPEEIKSLFKKTIDTGIQHGTVTVMIKSVGYEVTTYRVDGEYEDGRHPKEVTFTASLTEDLRRRDFTINAMAYNEQSGIIDCFGGVEDLNEGIIRCVGNSSERFTEDALRMLRAIRFSGELNFDISKDTLDAIKALAKTITKISRERIQVELDKLLVSQNPERIAKAFDTELIKYIFAKQSGSEIEILADKNELAGLLKNSKRNHYVRWAIFIDMLGINGVLKGLKFDNNTVKICEKLVKYKDLPLVCDEGGLREIIVKVGKDIFIEYYLPYRSAIKNIEEHALENVTKVAKVIFERGDALSIKELAVCGNDLAQIGVEKGRRMGEILEKLFACVIEDHQKNTKEELLEIAKKYI